MGVGLNSLRRRAPVGNSFYPKSPICENQNSLVQSCKRSNFHPNNRHTECGGTFQSDSLLTQNP
ncbi:hypothetical protein Pla52n_45550 [Stieleria varia]|uniref:Uncharacterized protein n=1 Tax=Stieleria varia TaxID=2528005 RepID=A0A5C6AM95_9BACT|nr:hypothetical protein Pla52n_45550 [Stieleria varia]